MLIQNSKFKIQNHWNLILIGMRGSGKTTLGKMLAEKLDYNFLDTDEEIEDNSGVKIKKMIEENGWDYFREQERKLITEIKEITKTVISTGGGVILNPLNIAELKENGVIIYIKTPIEILKERLKKSSDRPSLTGGDFLDEIDKVYKERKLKYEKSADFVFEKNEVDFNEKDIEEILKIIELNN